MRRRLLALGLLLAPLTLAVVLRSGLDRYADRMLNRVVAAGPPAADPSSRRLHNSLVVADLHADTLLWSRGLAWRADRGQVDLPRLVQGNVALQVFGVVTSTPFPQTMTTNVDLLDTAALLAFAHGWPASTWFSPLGRALAQARQLVDATQGTELRVVKTRAELEEVLAARAAGSPVVGALLGTEGAYPLEGQVENLLSLYAEGFRLLGISHFTDNAVAGSAHGWSRGGLTQLGRVVVARADEMGFTLDLAHASPAAFDQALALSHHPVVVSHTGVQATCPGPRNLTDEQLRAVARTGGVVGIALFEGAVCGTDVAATVSAMEHALRVAGPDHVGLGSDFDGAVTTPIDAAGWVEVTHALRARGHPDDVVARVMGGNVLRVLRANLR
ncbi:MAG: membrane dipeptidase [Deltaproteobacteria bacterium]|nr:membrane dipeptidase [Deltaproteobacteria bacterium]